LIGIYRYTTAAEYYRSMKKKKKKKMRNAHKNVKFCVTGVKVLADHDHMHTTISYMFR
jgi:hypothetical protein